MPHYTVTAVQRTKYSETTDDACVQVGEEVKEVPFYSLQLPLTFCLYMCDIVIID